MLSNVFSVFGANLSSGVRAAMSSSNHAFFCYQHRSFFNSSIVLYLITFDSAKHVYPNRGSAQSKHHSVLGRIMPPGGVHILISSI